MATANKKTENNVTSFIEILKRSNSTIKADRANRIGVAAQMSYTEALNKMQKELFEIENKLEEMTDLSADNRTTSMNSIRELKTDDFVEERKKLRWDKRILEAKIQDFKEDAEFYGVKL